MTTITLQPSPRVDNIVDGIEMTQLPYPFHVDADTGDVGRQDFWRGDPARVVGFQKDLAVQRIDLWWRDAVKNPEQVVGMYVVTAGTSGLGVHVLAIAEVRVTDGSLS